MMIEFVVFLPIKYCSMDISHNLVFVMFFWNLVDGEMEGNLSKNEWLGVVVVVVVDNCVLVGTVVEGWSDGGIVCARVGSKEVREAIEGCLDGVKVGDETVGKIVLLVGTIDGWFDNVVWDGVDDRRKDGT